MDQSTQIDILEQQLVNLTRLVEVSLVLNSTLALDPLLQFIMDSAIQVTSSEASSILLKDKHTNDLVFAASSEGSASELLGKPVPLEGSIAGTILKSDSPVAIDDVSQDPRHYRQVDQQTDFQTRSLLGVPMRIKQDVIGVLEVVNKKNGGWTEHDQAFLSSLAAQAAVAIENSQLVSALRTAYEELDQLDKLKNDFISIASHELRTPLGVILGYASFLREDTRGDTSAQHADAVFRSALQLRSIIEQMTNLRYLKAGEVELVRSHVSVGSMLKIVEQDVVPLVTAKGQQLEVFLPDPDVVIYADEHKISSTLNNLLNNAVKFTPHGGTITVRTMIRGAEVWISVEDSGIGIPSDKLERIFDEFFQVEDHMTRRQGGMGLGLSIARALIQSHGGRIWAESQGPGTGSKFTMSLPITIV